MPAGAFRARRPGSGCVVDSDNGAGWSRRPVAMGSSAGVERPLEPQPTGLLRKLPADARRRRRVGEENGSERDRGGSRRDQLERVPPRLDAAHAHDGQAGRAVAGVHGGERNRPQSGAGEASRRRAEAGLERVRVEGDPAERVDEREAVRACFRGGAGSRGKVRERRGELRVKRLRRSPPALRRRSRALIRPAPPRWDRTGSARWCATASSPSSRAHRSA